MFPKQHLSILLLFLTCSFTMLAQAPTSLQYPTPNVFKVNTDEAFLSPTVSGNVTSYSISPSLPSGLLFSTSTGVISGMPTVVTGTTMYTITATNASGSASKIISVQTPQYYYSNAGGAVVFTDTNRVFKKTADPAKPGQSVGDIALYKNVTILSGIIIDCIVKTVNVTAGTTWQAYDQPAVSGTSFSSNDDKFFSPQVSFPTGGGNIRFEFQFIAGGSYIDASNTGTNVILQTVQLNTYDIDGNGSAIQYNEFGGFDTTELSSTPATKEIVSFNSATQNTRFTSNTNANTTAVTAPENRIRVKYKQISSVTIEAGADAVGTAFYFLDFSAGSVFTAISTPAPVLDLNTNILGVNNSVAGCASALNFSGGSPQTNVQSSGNIDEYTMYFTTSKILDGLNEKLFIAGATSGGTITLNFANGASIPNIVFGTTITYSVTAKVSNDSSLLTFKRISGTSAFTASAADQLTDAFQYQNLATTSTPGSRSFTLNVKSGNYRSPDAIFTALLNCVNIKGHIYHDANALTDNIVNPNSTTGQFANGSLYAVLVSAATGKVIKTNSVTGSLYDFGTVDQGAYNIYFSTANPAVGAVFSTSAYPAGGYISTGENLGAGTGNDLAVDGALKLTLGSIAVTEANFGLQIPPVISGTDLSGSLNPGGFNDKLIPGVNFGATDADGTVVSITITAFPLNADYIKIGSVYYTNGGTCPAQTSCTNWPGSVSIAYISGAPVSAISVDPIDGATTVKIAYQSTDNGAAKSLTDTIDIPFTIPSTPLSISGNVWNDANGDGLLNGGELLTNAAKSGEILYAVLIQTTNTYSGANTILASVAVNTSTGYTFANVPAGNNYIVKIISRASMPTDGAAQATLTPALATGYAGVSTSNNGTIATGLSTNDLSNNLTAFSASVANVNFGIDRTPVANAQSYVISTPVYNSTLILNGTGSTSSPGTLTGSDPEDQPVSGSLATRTVQITSLPTNGHELYYNGIKITFGKDGLTAPSAINPFVITNFDPAKLSVKFTGSGTVSTDFTYKYVDAAGQLSVTATYSITWAVALPLKLISFSASALNTAHQVRWVVSNEINITSYELEASANGLAYTKAGSVIATDAMQEHSYSFTNGGTGNAKIYYRLKIINADGSFIYSNTVSAELLKAIVWAVSPNPTTGIVKCAGLPANSTVKVTDATGREVLSVTNVSSIQTLDLTMMGDGVYYIRAIDRNGNRIAQTILIKQ